FIAESRQDDEFLGLLRRRRLVVNLSRQITSILNFVDRALRSDSDSPSQPNDLRVGREEASVNRSKGACAGGAGNSGHEVTSNPSFLSPESKSCRHRCGS